MGKFNIGRSNSSTQPISHSAPEQLLSTMYIDRPVETIKEVTVYKDRIIEVIKEMPVIKKEIEVQEKIVYVDRPVETIKEVIVEVDRPVTIHKIERVEVPVEKIIRVIDIEEIVTLRRSLKRKENKARLAYLGLAVSLLLNFILCLR